MTAADTRQPFWSAALDSLVYPSSYARVTRQPLRRAVGYLAWLIVCSALAGAVLTQLHFARWVREASPAWLQRLPPITITDGRVSSPVQQPWIYADPGGQFVLILDTTGKTTTIDERHPQGVLLTERDLISKRSARRTDTTSLASVRSFTFNADVGRRWLRSLLWFCIPLLWVATVLYLAVAKPLQIFCFSVWLMLLNALLGRGWSYRALWMMGAYALTGPALLNLLMAVVTPTLPLGVGGLIITGAYLVYLTLAAAQPVPGSPPQETGPA